MREALARFGRAGIAFIFGSVAVWVLLLILIPHLMLLDYAFHANPGAVNKGLVGDGFTLYSFGPLFDPKDDLAFQTFLRTLLTSGVITILALIVCYPIAYYLAKVATQMAAYPDALPAGAVLGQRGAARLCLAHADGEAGPAESAAVAMGFEPVEYFNYELPILDANIALFVGLVYSYILFMVFPMFNAMESLDRNQVEAARDLGASWVRVHRKVVIPHAKPGIASGCIVMFMLTRRLLHRAGAAGRQVQLLVHPGDRIAVLGAELERRLGLCARAGTGLPRLRRW